MKLKKLSDINDYIKLGKILFPICRSLTGNGNRQTLKILKKRISNLKILEIPSGKKIYDWEVPPEWNVDDAYIKDENGKKIIDFKNSNLHIINYSSPISKKIKFKDLKKNLHYLKKQPKYIPYITSYYKRKWGFCLSYNHFKKLEKEYEPNSIFKAEIKSSFKKRGSLSIGEAIIKGKSEKEILISTYMCHPSTCNDNLSGILLSTILYEHYKKNPCKYTLRFVFLPEIIGSISYINKRFKILKKNIIAGYNLTCVGDERNFSFIPSKKKNSLTNQSALKVFKENKLKIKKYDFGDFRSDEGNYNSHGIDLEVATFCRTKYGEFKEYHTSADDFKVLTKNGLHKSYIIMVKIIDKISNLLLPVCKVFCEPQLGKRGLHPLLGTKDKKTQVKKFINFLQYSNGANEISDIAKLIKVDINECSQIYKTLKKKKLV